MQRASLKLAICICVVGLRAWASPPEPTLTQAQTCTLNSAAHAQILDIMTDYNPHVGKCVKLHGLMAFRGLYDKPESLYERRESFRLPDPGYLAVYGSPVVSNDILWPYRGGADVAGIVSACDLIDTKPEKPDQIVMVIGNCHYQDGPLIYVTEFRSASDIPARLFGPKASSAYGTLKTLNANKVSDDRRKTVKGWFETIRAGNVQELKKLLGWTFSERDQELKDLVDPEKSPYKWLLESSAVPKVQFFSNPDNSESHDVIGCVCKVGDCGDRWPITGGDADDRPEWPYACVTVYSTGSIAF